MEKAKVPVPRKPGRPLGFDREAALRQAMLLFWRHGYESTSVNDLVKAMGITPPSLYTAFGDKKQLFLEAVHLYLSGGPAPPGSIPEEAATSREAAAWLLNAAATGFTDSASPAGCLVASSAISCSPAAADVQQALAKIRLNTESRLRDKIVQDQQAGDLPQELDADALAGHIMAVIQGMSTLARDGAKREKLLAVATMAMLVWPDHKIPKRTFSRRITHLPPPPLPARNNPRSNSHPKGSS